MNSGRYRHLVGHLLHHASASWLFIFVFLFLACKDDDEININGLNQLIQELASQPQRADVYLQNHPLPMGLGHLRVLAIGNSFTEDAVYFVDDLLDSAHIDASTYSVYFVSHASASLEHWCKVAEENQPLTLTYTAGKRMPIESGTLPEILAQDWDVITLQQKSDDAINYDSFNPWLRQLIDLALQYCPNPNVTLAWQTAWSYNDTFMTEYSNYACWQLIILAMLKMRANDGIDLIIPVGTAIQNARNTSLNSESQLTRDGWHLDYGIGRYIAACTWVEALFAPVYGFSVIGNLAMPVMGEFPPTRYNPTPVTEENRSIAQHCAVAAVANPFGITRINEN
ncbi:MAG: DUF4886 domain-containing protein [Bacteroidaceae bacterium]|nr:DUF4886 domain-containing protein [Bacteroidaceae bacterium]